MGTSGGPFTKDSLLAPSDIWHSRVNIEETIHAEDWGTYTTKTKQAWGWRVAQHKNFMQNHAERNKTSSPVTITSRCSVSTKKSEKTHAIHIDVM